VPEIDETKVTANDDYVVILLRRPLFEDRSQRWKHV
jgi:hypothetical protein